MKKIIAGLTTVALLTVGLQAGHRGGGKGQATTTSLSQPIFMGGKHGGHPILRAVTQISTITTAQLTSISTILSDERTAMQNLHTERVTNSPMSKFISTTTGLDREDFLTAEAEFSAKMATIKADTISSILATLLPEQITELITLLQAVEVTSATTTTESNTTN